MCWGGHFFVELPTTDFCFSLKLKLGAGYLFFFHIVGISLWGKTGAAFFFLFKNFILKNKNNQGGAFFFFPMFCF